MTNQMRQERIEKLRGELKAIEKRVELTLRKSNEAFNLGGDGWHDNSAYAAMVADVDKLGVMADQIKEELRELQKKRGKVIIVHGTFGTGSGNWFADLTRKLSQANYRVIRPQFPTPKNQTFQNWSKVLNLTAGRLDQNTILVGHSSAGAFLLRVLEKSQRQIGAAFFVAPFAGDLGLKEFDPLNRVFYRGGYDWEKIRRHCRKFSVYASDNDPYVPLSLSREVADLLRVKLILVKGAGHFNEPSGFTKFPRLVSDIRKVVEQR